MSGEVLNHFSGTKGLFNGNIAWMVTDLDRFAQTTAPKMGVQAMAYKYDQLNRISQARSFEGWMGTWDGTRPYGGFYDTDYTYDGNGNILTLDRFAYHDSYPTIPAGMDQLTYTYTDTPGAPKTNNQLLHVNDCEDPYSLPSSSCVGFDGLFTEDINDQGSLIGSSDFDGKPFAF